MLINDTYAIYSQALGPFIIIDNTTILRGASIRGVTAIEYPIQNNYIVGQLLAYTGGQYPFIAWFITNTTISSTLPGTLYQAQYGSDAYMLYEQTASLLNSTVSATAVYSPASPTSITISALTATTITQPNITAEAVSWKSNGTLSYSVKAVTLEPVSIDWQNYLGLLITLSGYVNVTYTGTATASITTSKGITGNGITSVYLISLLALGYRYVGYGCNTGDILYNVSIPGTTYYALFTSLKEYTVIPLTDLSSPVYPGQWFTLDNLTIKPIVVQTSYTPNIGGNNVLKASDYNNYLNKLLLTPVSVNITLDSTVSTTKFYSVTLYYYGADNGMLYMNNTIIGLPSLNIVVESKLVPAPNIPNYIQRVFIPSPDRRVVPFISTAILEKCLNTVLPVLEEVPVIGFLDTISGKTIYQVKMDYPSTGIVEDIVGITGSIIAGVAEENGMYYGIILMPYGYPSVYSGTLF
ncbi:MAG: hypothetical protein GXO26_03765, partial [Crenarchaeota archaeon]|nr:hypothetical protein [Thermoproteota archaeon]